MVLIVENDPDVPAGILKPLLIEKGLPYSIHRAHSEESRGDISRITGLVVLGGAMSTSDEDRFPFLLYVKGLMNGSIERGIPVLGICLGGQLLAEVAGGGVERESHGERGLHDVVLTRDGKRDPLFAGLPERFTVFQWHNDSFTPPENAVPLAGSPNCAHQAFRIGKHAYGIQFHPEVEERIASSWAADTPSSAQIEAAFHSYRQEGLDLASRRLLRNFIRMTTHGQTPP
ncbi:MAG: type 1 glutamine amidotransferase [Syntrophobacteraceae bacterium]|nr:type 1 glutamine amidotransferase [Syntrophobacteraceae bacterium]